MFHERRSKRRWVSSGEELCASPALQKSTEIRPFLGEPIDGWDMPNKGKQEDMKDKVVSFRIAAALAWFLVFAAPVWAAGLPNDAGLAATTVSHAVTGPSSGAQPWEPRDGAVVWPSTDPLGEVLGYGHFPICSGTGCSEDRDCWGGPTCACNDGTCTSSHTHPTRVHVGDDSGGLRLSTQGWSSMRTPRMLLLLGPKGLVTS